MVWNFFLCVSNVSMRFPEQFDEVFQGCHLQFCAFITERRYDLSTNKNFSSLGKCYTKLEVFSNKLVSKFCNQHIFPIRVLNMDKKDVIVVTPENIFQLFKKKNLSSRKNYHSAKKGHIHVKFQKIVYRV